MIEQHLKKTGKEMYFKASRDQSYSFRKTMKFIWDTFSESSDINLTIGKPMDVLGNLVNEDGESIDSKNRVINLEEYFYTNGQVVRNRQREMEYTKRLGERIVQRYFNDNLVLSSHLVAFVAFNIFKAKNPNLDIYGILRLPPEEYIFPMEEMVGATKELRDILFEMEMVGEIQLSKEISGDIEKLIVEGIKRLGTYHAKQPLKINKKGEIISQDLNVLFFYHNRLTNYGFEKSVRFQDYKIIEVES